MMHISALIYAQIYVHAQKKTYKKSIQIKITQKLDKKKYNFFLKKLRLVKGNIPWKFKKNRYSIKNLCQ